MHGGAIGIVVGAILLGPVGAAAGAAAGAALGGVHNKLNDFGLDDKMMKLVAGEVDNGRSAVFMLYEGNWLSSLDLVKQAVLDEGALLSYSTLSAENAAAFQAFLEPVAEQLGGEEVVTDYEIDVEEERAAAEEVEEAPAVAAAAAAATAGSRRRPDAACWGRAQGSRGTCRGRLRDVCGPGRGQRATGPSRSAQR